MITREGTETPAQEREREAQEAALMREFPGVEFWWSNGERRAKIRGSGIEVWEAVMILRDMEFNVTQGIEMWPHIGADDLAMALAFYRAHPDEVDQLVAWNDAIYEEHLAQVREERAAYEA